MLSGAFCTFFLSRMKLTSLFLPSGASASTAISTPTAIGRITLVHLTSQSCRLPGSAHRCLVARRLACASAIVGENVLLGPAGDVEERARRQEVEAGLRKRGAVLALEPFVELFLQGVEIADIARRIFALRVGKLSCTPVAGLLLLGYLDIEKLLDQVLEPMAVGISAHQARRSPRAIEGGSHDPEIGLHDPDIESSEMVELEPVRVRQERLEVRRRIIAPAPDS